MAGADLTPVAGSKIYIGGVLPTKLSDFTIADFAGQVWTEIDGWMNKGSLGDSFDQIETALINRSRVVRQKGTANAEPMENTFAIIPEDPGQAALIAASKTRHNYAFRVINSDAPAVEAETVTITIASPGVVSWTAHGLANGTPIVLSTTGALPTGLTAGTTYYVTGATTDAFSLSATSGGAAINTTGTQSGVHTATTAPVGTVEYFVALVMTAPNAGGEANTVSSLSATLAVNSNIVSVAPIG
jgi:hypothetical protein